MLAAYKDETTWKISNCSHFVSHWIRIKPLLMTLFSLCCSWGIYCPSSMWTYFRNVFHKYLLQYWNSNAGIEQLFIITSWSLNKLLFNVKPLEHIILLSKNSLNMLKYVAYALQWPCFSQGKFWNVYTCLYKWLVLN